MTLAATRTVEIGFSSNPGTAIGSTTWTDVTSDVRSVTTHRGRQRELDQFAAGTATIVLNNRLRRYDPQYTGAGAPYNGNILPMRRIRIRGVYNAVTYDLFSGFIDGWEQRYDPPNEATAVVTATDAFKVLANIALLSPYGEEVQTDIPTLWWRLGDPAGSTSAGEMVGGIRQLSAMGSPTFGSPGLGTHDPDTAVKFPTPSDGLQGLFPEGTWPFTTAMTVEFMERYDTAITASDQIVLFAVIPSAGGSSNGVAANFNGGTFGLDVSAVNNAGTSFTATTTGVDFQNPVGQTHHVAIVINAGSTIKIYVDGIDRTAGGAGTFTGTFANTTNKWFAAVGFYNYPPYLQNGARMTADEVAVYTSALSAARILAHATAMSTPWRNDTTGARVGRILDAIEWPAADRNIATGLSVLQSADLNTAALDVLQKVEATEQGLLIVNAAGQVLFVGRTELNSAPYTTSQATFGDSGAELRYTNVAFTYNDQLLYNEINVNRTGGTVQTASDATSQTTYLKRSQTLTGLLHNTDSASRDLANYRLAIYKDPLDRLTGLTIAPERAPATLYPQVLGREIGARVTVKRRPQGVGSAISQDANIEGISHTITPDSWVTTWNLSPANVLQFWLAGVAGASEAGQTTRAAF